MTDQIVNLFALLAGSFIGAGLIALLWRASVLRRREIAEMADNAEWAEKEYAPGPSRSFDLSNPNGVYDNGAGTVVVTPRSPPTAGFLWGNDVVAEKAKLDNLPGLETDVVPCKVRNTTRPSLILDEEPDTQREPVTNPAKLMSLFLVLGLMGCSVPLGTPPATSVDAVKLARCAKLEDRRATWGAVEIWSLVVAGGSGATTVPVESDEAEIVAASVSLAAAATAAVALYLEEAATDQLMKECPSHD